MWNACPHDGSFARMRASFGSAIAPSQHKTCIEPARRGAAYMGLAQWSVDVIGMDASLSDLCQSPLNNFSEPSKKCLRTLKQPSRSPQ